MSTSWGSLLGDAGFRPDGSSASSETDVQRRARLHGDEGAWPENIDIQFYADTSMTIPGKGEQPESCGAWYANEFCEACGEPRLGRSRCETRSCPECWKRWRRRRSEKICRRLGAAREVEDNGLDKRAIHAVISPPEGEIRSLADVQNGFRDAYQIAKDKGVRGGVAIFHGWRVSQWAKDAFQELNDANLVDGGLWKWVREHDRDWRDLTYWSPHWHIIGLSRDFEANDPDAQDGWVAERIRSLKSFKTTEMEGFKDMVGCSMYLLSHTGFEADTSKDSIRWFGDLATTKFSPEEELSTGKWNVIKRKAEQAAQPGRGEDDESEGEGFFEEEEDACDNCGSTSFSPIWDAGRALQDRSWVKSIGRGQEQRLRVAFEWAIGEVVPPPGMKNPRTRAEAEEVLSELLGSDWSRESDKNSDDEPDGGSEEESELEDESLPPKGEVEGPDCYEVPWEAHSTDD